MALFSPKQLFRALKPTCRRCRRRGPEICMGCFEEIMKEVVGMDSKIVRKLLDPRLAALIEVSRIVAALLEAGDALSQECPELARRCDQMASELAEAKDRFKMQAHDTLRSGNPLERE